MFKCILELMDSIIYSSYSINLSKFIRCYVETHKSSKLSKRFRRLLNLNRVVAVCFFLLLHIVFVFSLLDCRGITEFNIFNVLDFVCSSLLFLPISLLFFCVLYIIVKLLLLESKIQSIGKEFRYIYID